MADKLNLPFTVYHCLTRQCLRLATTPFSPPPPPTSFTWLPLYEFRMKNYKSLIMITSSQILCWENSYNLEDSQIALIHFE
uniref:Uncharacterized protein n=1 Tax=Oryza brachyantha TaxID=4533 RepID=J3MG18_ORYBR